MSKNQFDTSDTAELRFLHRAFDQHLRDALVDEFRKASEPVIQSAATAAMRELETRLSVMRDNMFDGVIMKLTVNNREVPNGK